MPLEYIQEASTRKNLNNSKLKQFQYCKLSIYKDIINLLVCYLFTKIVIFLLQTRLIDNFFIYQRY